MSASNLDDPITPTSAHEWQPYNGGRYYDLVQHLSSGNSPITPKHEHVLETRADTMRVVKDYTSDAGPPLFHKTAICTANQLGVRLFGLVADYQPARFHIGNTNKKFKKVKCQFGDYNNINTRNFGLTIPTHSAFNMDGRLQTISFKPKARAYYEFLFDKDKLEKHFGIDVRAVSIKENAERKEINNEYRFHYEKEGPYNMRLVPFPLHEKGYNLSPEDVNSEYDGDVLPRALRYYVHEQREANTPIDGDPGERRETFPYVLTFGMDSISTDYKYDTPVPRAGTPVEAFCTVLNSLMTTCLSKCADGFVAMEFGDFVYAAAVSGHILRRFLNTNAHCLLSVYIYKIPTDNQDAFFSGLFDSTDGEDFLQSEKNELINMEMHEMKTADNVVAEQLNEWGEVPAEEWSLHKAKRKKALNNPVPTNEWLLWDIDLDTFDNLEGEETINDMWQMDPEFLNTLFDEDE